MHNQSSNQVSFLPPNSKFAQRINPQTNPQRTTSVNTGMIEANYPSSLNNSALQSRQKPERMFGGNKRREESSFYSPFLQKRNLNDISNYGQQLFTPNKPALQDENDEEDTLKPDFGQNTVQRMSQNRFNQSRSIRQRLNCSKLVNLQQEQSIKNKSRSPAPTFLKSKPNQFNSPKFGSRCPSVEEETESQKFFTPFQDPNRQVNSTDKIIENFKFGQKQKALAETQFSLEQLAIEHANIEANDLFNQSDLRMDDDHMAVTGVQSGVGQTNQYEFEPALMQASAESNVPTQILGSILEASQDDQAQVSQGFVVDNIIYFIINKSLFLWDATPNSQSHPQNKSTLKKIKTQSVGKRDFATCIQQVYYVESKDLTPMLFVVTTTDIQLFGFKPLDQASLSAQMFQNQIKRKNYDLTTLQDIGFKPFPLDTETEIVTAFAQIKKTGRIFYASYKGNFQNAQLKEISLDQQGGNGLYSFIQQSSENKRLKVEKVVDENENLFRRGVKQMLPSFLNFFSYQEMITSIKVDEQRNIMYVLRYEIVSAKNQERGPASIDVYDLGLLGDIFAKVMVIKESEIVKEIESIIDFQVKAIQQKFRIHSIFPVLTCESQILNLLVVTEYGLRIYITLDEIAIKFESNPQIQESVQNQKLQFDYLYTQRPGQNWHIKAIHSLPCTTDADAIYSQRPDLFKIINIVKSSQSNLCLSNTQYSSDASCLAINTFQESFEENHRLNLSFVLKNESQYAYLRERVKDIGGIPGKHTFHLKENVAVLIIERLDSTDFQENIVIVDSDIKIGEKATCQLNLNTQRMLGYSQALQVGQGWGLTNQHQLMPLSLLERQVYEHHFIHKVLTTKRFIEVAQLRPIDHLAGILVHIVNLNKLDIQTFEDFCNKFSIEETCAMLVQLISDIKSGTYCFSHKVQKALVATQKLMNKERAHYQQKQVFGQPRQTTRFGTNSKGFSQTSLQRLKQVEIDQDELYPFVYYQNENLNENCYVQSIQGDKIPELALYLLAIYGNSTRTGLFEEFKMYLKEYAFEVAKTDLYPIRMRAIILYLQRLLRPIWETKLTFRQTFKNYEKQISNFESFLPALSKLRNFLEFLEHNHTSLTRQYKANEQASILGQSYSTQNQVIQNSLITDAITLCSSHLDSSTAEKQEMLERKVLQNLQYFTRRCIDVIEFLKIISFDGNQEFFGTLLQQLKRENSAKGQLLEELAQTTFRDLVIEGSSGDVTMEDEESSFVNLDEVNGCKKSSFLTKLFQASVLLSNQVSQKDKSHNNVNLANLFKHQVSQIQRHCPTLFNQTSSQIFIGTSLLQQAVIEKDDKKRDELINDGLKNITQMLELLNVKDIVDVLARMNMFACLVDLCLRKSQYLKAIQEYTRNPSDEGIKQVQDCYDIIIYMFEALDKSITQQKYKQIGVNQPQAPDLDKKKSGYFEKFFAQFQNKSYDIQEKISLRKTIFSLVQQHDDQALMRELFIYMVNNSNEILQTFELPVLDIENLRLVIKDTLFKSNTLKKQCLDILVKQMMNTKVYGTAFKTLICDLMIRLCEEPHLKVLNPMNHDIMAEYLTCSEKIEYCKYAMDLLAFNSSYNQGEFDSESIPKFREILKENVDHFELQMEIIKAMTERKAYLKQVRTNQNRQFQEKIDKDLTNLEEAIKTLEITKVDEFQLHEKFVNDLCLYQESFKFLKRKADQLQTLRMSNRNYMHEFQINEKQFFDTFVRMHLELSTLKPHSEFKAFLMLQMYTQNAKLMEKAVDFLLTSRQEALSKRSGDDQKFKIVSLIQNLLDNNKNIFECEVFDMLGYLYTFSALRPVVKAIDIHNIIYGKFQDSNQRGGSLEFTLTQFLVSLNYLISISSLDQQKNQLAFRLYDMLPEAFEQQMRLPSTDLKEHIPLLRKQFAEVLKIIEDHELLWISSYAKEIKKYKDVVSAKLDKFNQVKV